MTRHPMRPWLVLVAALLGAAFPGGPAQAQFFSNCNLRFESIGDATFDGSGGRGYDPFVAANGLTAVDFTVSNTSSSGCYFFYTVSRGQSGSYDRKAGLGGQTIRYNVYNSPSAGAEPLRDITDATFSTVGLQYIAGKRTETVRYYIDVPSLQLVGQGDYTDVLEFGLFSGFPGIFYDREDSDDVRITVPVMPVIDVEIAAGGVRVPLDGASLTLDFGTLEPRESQDFNLYVRGNAPYRVEILSENRGVLLLQDHATDHNTIPYTLAIDGGQLSLSSPMLLSYGSVGSGARQHRGRITIGDFDTVLRGTYSDVLTVSVTAN